MIINCEPCGGTGLLGDITCMYCNGDGELDLTDPEFKHMLTGPRRALQGIIWSQMFTKLGTLQADVGDLTDKVNDIMDKCNDIFEKVNE